MELSKRLQAVADLVSIGRRVADIGCDHGYTSVYLAASGKCSGVIAMDVKKGPLQHAKETVEKYGMSQYIDIRLSNGTEALQEGEADALLISGMGGRLIRRILADSFSNLGFFPELVLQPQSEIELVRRFLREQSYSIVDEDFVTEDGKYYTVIKAVYIGDTLSGNTGKGADECPYPLHLQDLFGPVLLQKRPEGFISYLKFKKEKTEMLLDRITQPQKKQEMLQLWKDLDYILSSRD